MAAPRVSRFRSTFAVLLASVAAAGCSTSGDSAPEVERDADVVAAVTTDVRSDDGPIASDAAEEVVGEVSEESAVNAESLPPSPSTTTVSTPAFTSTSTTSAAPAPDPASGLLGALAVAAEGSRNGYDRSLFSHWRDTNGSGCDARQDTLAEQVIGFPQVDLFDSCVIVEGDWYSIFDGVTHAGSPSELDIDHVVALAEAWDSGASNWDSATRRRFANDPAHLVAVTASSNRSKGDSDLAEWRPLRSAWCVTATITAQVKAAYGLSVDRAEYDAIAEMLGTCGGSGQVTLGVAPAESAPVVTVAPTNPATTAVAPTEPAPPAASPDDGSSDDESVEVCVDVNTASAEALDEIVHIGPSRAADIIALRPFTSVEDLIRVSGIGDARLADIVEQGLACVG
ncbi:MAG: helix-hairpin-helix domain-containing protein [Actinomycetota bacterium]|nr:helix-hairpin-helix domain-containing protein [Actinomycetota bacterium]